MRILREQDVAELPLARIAPKTRTAPVARSVDMASSTEDIVPVQSGTQAITDGIVIEQ